MSISHPPTQVDRSFQLDAPLPTAAGCCPAILTSCENILHGLASFPPPTVLGEMPYKGGLGILVLSCNFKETQP